MDDDLLNMSPLLPAHGGTVAVVLLDGVRDLEFDYAVPDALAVTLAVGARVLVPLQNRQITGTVLRLMDRATESGPRLKSILKKYDDRPMVTPQLLQLARWMSDYYCTSMESIVRAMLPESIRTDQFHAKHRRMVRLLPKEGEAEAFAALERKAKVQAQIITALREAGQPVPSTEFSAPSLKALEKTGWIIFEAERVARDPHEADEFIPTTPLELNSEQAVCLAQILESVANPEVAKPILLHGITGSGKTEVYLQATERALAMGKSVLVLVPEISLTPQTVDRFKSRFAQMQNQVAALHSHLSQGERFDEWHKVHTGVARIVIGARSAVFAPIDNLGLIIVDEEHETSYKQESPPRYHARDVAVVRSTIERCAIILGSATPSLESFYNTQRGKYALCQLTERADAARLPLIRIIDLRTEKRSGGGPVILSERLRIAIDQRLARGEQSILFLNRRGFASSMQCPACGVAIKCQHCSISLTLHKDANRLICHICGFQKLAPRRCPECADPGILMAGFGTERVADAVSKSFPKARAARVDADAMGQKTTLRDTLAAFKAQKLDLLIGTQMIAKGLHFPNVTLVGILNADLALHTPDFRAAERTFSLLTQVAGRAGRGELLGEVVVQTFSPHVPAIQFARQHDFHGFAEQEMEVRRQFGYPPYGRAVLVTARSEHQARAEFILTTIHRHLQAKLPPDILMSDPSPSPLEKSHNQFRFQILLRARATRPITELLQSVLRTQRLGKDVTLVIDVDPVSLS
jgi:primosomal protein N' (replication factor Y) (superfamily II helicase)